MNRPRLLAAVRRLMVVGVIAALVPLGAPMAHAAPSAARSPGAVPPVAVPPVATAVSTTSSKATPSMTVTASAVDAAHRAVISIRVAGAGVTGLVTVTRRGEAYGTRRLVDGAATVRLPKFPTGRYGFLVAYQGNASYTRTSAIARLRVTKAHPAMRLTARAVDLAHRPTIAAYVHGGAGPATGVVKVTRSGTAYGTRRLVDERASVTLPKLAVGRHAFRVSYYGDSQYKFRSLVVYVTVTKAKPSLSVPARNVARHHRATISITATGDAGTPTGRVTVTRWGTSYGTRTLKSGKASVLFPTFAPGSYTFVVRYLGSARYRATSTTVRVVVTPGAHQFADGMHRVGPGIVPGLYRAKVPAGEVCYWERLKDATGSFSSIIANELVKGYALIQVSSTDKYVNSAGCGTFRLVSETPAWRFGGTIPGNGMFLVGKDIRPGLYRQTKAGCYWERDRAASGMFEDLIANDYTEGASYVRIRSSDKVFVTSRCSTFARVG